ncbi:gamma subclass chorismate mutase AroQ [Kordiimonas lacus]|uniref:chorismate mutase n=1 Tax=Kordiimonas lacus TaxID=637679 RepID=A0A1G6UFT4_9PROT|nr:gamma subclass chorismate mutase AroQ [Kordiimonas lacus]SDD39457.1 chorismate mutase, putative [Kordiimonas lacus]
MTRLFAFLFIVLIATPAALADATIYLVRHAEKVADGTRDPDLTAMGRARADWIAGYLADKGLTGIYSTDYKRTRETAQPTAEKTGLAVNLYDPRALDAFAAELKSKDGVFLVVGHSNTTPMLANLLAGSHLKYAGEDVYDQIFKVKLSEAGAANVSVSFSKPRQDHMARLETLKEAIASRLGVMADVARYKWNNDLPIEAPEREARIIDTTTQRAVEMGLDPAFARQAIFMQMEASKLLQRELFEVWIPNEQPPFESIPSLADDIRPRIDILTDALLDAVQKAEFLLAFCPSLPVLGEKPEGTDFSWAVWGEAVMGLHPTTECIAID